MGEAAYEGLFAGAAHGADANARDRDRCDIVTVVAVAKMVAMLEKAGARQR
jgi:hypothetical protein